ncbi:carnitine dehydratase [Rhodococcus sp. SC4]|uniref:CaiB/BaiF CoA transferase family protein n=1 Tax=Rhodococcus sp. LB1 TaxID=1807499 RepID=UPI000769A246|nr:CoA transferase [Rhodococcus sp. LB1]KXF56099.1 carnitine dehydratase [Rhodococcus sp. SC4]KXX55748.1 carnitine dehydratase [Rhodococcus sp. LB1]
MPDSEYAPDDLPLSGITVVDFGQYIAAPGAAQTLADLGADVLKIEGPGGDQARGIGVYGEAIMRAYNRRKKSIVLDLKAEDDLRHARALIARADVVIHNLRPGVMEKLGLSADEIRELNPTVILAAVSGFGTDGPSRRRPGLDIAAQAETGMMSVTGEADGDPQRVGFPLVDHATSYVVTQAVLAALFRRERTGLGDDIDVSLLDVAIDLQCVNWGEYSITGVAPHRRGNGQPTAAPAADIFPTADGSIVISAYTEQRFVQLCDLAGQPDLPKDPRFVDNPSRVAHRGELLAALTPFFAGLDTEAALAALTSVGIVAGAVRTYDQVPSAPDVIASGIFTTGSTGDGHTYSIPGLPYRSRSTPRTADAGRVPELGEHSHEIVAHYQLGEYSLT